MPLRQSRECKLTCNLPSSIIRAFTCNFMSVHGQVGVVNFPVPYRQAPNVELDVNSFNKTFVSECTSTGFKWKNTGADDSWNNASVGWVASGIR